MEDSSRAAEDIQKSLEPDRFDIIVHAGLESHHQTWRALSEKMRWRYTFNFSPSLSVRLMTLPPALRRTVWLGLSYLTFWRRNPSPPKKAAPNRLWKATVMSTSGELQM
jgi:hypothetical protein